MNIQLILINRNIDMVAHNLISCDFEEDIVYQGSDPKELARRSEGYAADDLSVISFSDTFLTAYSYNSWNRRFNR